MIAEILHYETRVAERAYASPYHAHDFLQVDFLIRGTADVRFESDVVTLGRQEAILIASHVAHAFQYDDPATQWVSLKFRGSWDFDGFRLLHRSDASVSLGRSVYLLAESGGAGAVAALAHLADAACCLFLPERVESGDKRLTPFVRRVLESIRSCGGMSIRVSELAAAMGYSVGRLSARFREEYGRPLKTVIDAERAALAGRLLLYSERTISAIAEEMGFNDVYSFSRFFKRLHGMSPRAYRRGGGLRTDPRISGQPSRIVIESSSSPETRND